MARPAERERGFALVTVLWAAMILAIIAASVMQTGRTETRIARNRLQAAELNAIADAALNIAILRLLDPSIPMQPPVDATPFAVSFAGYTVRVRVQDEAGRIDLNTAQEALLLRLLISVGIAPEPAQVLVDRILDWRDPGIDKRLNGAKVNEYHDAGLSYGPRNGPFEAVDELRLVLGMTRPLFDLLAPALTVYSQTPWVDVDVAPEQVLRALVDERRIGSILDARRAEMTEDGTMRAPTADSASVKLGHTFTITAEVAGPAPLRAERRAVVRLTGYRKPAVLVYRWN